MKRKIIALFTASPIAAVGSALLAQETGILAPKNGYYHVHDMMWTGKDWGSFSTKN